MTVESGRLAHPQSELGLVLIGMAGGEGDGYEDHPEMDDHAAPRPADAARPPGPGG